MPNLVEERKVKVCFLCSRTASPHVNTLFPFYVIFVFLCNLTFAMC